MSLRRHWYRKQIRVVGFDTVMFNALLTPHQSALLDHIGTAFKALSNETKDVVLSQPINMNAINALLDEIGNKANAALVERKQQLVHEQINAMALNFSLLKL